MRFVLPVIVLAQFLCTSLWFAGNSIVADIAKDFQLDARFLAHLTSAIQFGFISGTLVFAMLAIPDRFSPSKVFFISSMLAGLLNLGISLANIPPSVILLFRFSTGFFLAGIYPVGMKIAADYYKAGLGRSLGFLVGALVLGTAFPHLLKGMLAGSNWKFVIYITTILSFAGGLILFLSVPDGPYRKATQKIMFTSFLRGFRSRNFRAASFGYFGHMWELYTFWAFVPVMLTTFHSLNPSININVPLLSFLIIATGAPGCVFGGLLSVRYGTKKIAGIALLLSCACCLLSPFFLFSHSLSVLLVFLFTWSLFVIADSPLFSAMVAGSAPDATRGTSLTIVNCIGFSFTIVSIQFISALSATLDVKYVYMLLAIGPFFGLISLFSNSES